MLYSPKDRCVRKLDFSPAVSPDKPQKRNRFIPTREASNLESAFLLAQSNRAEY